MAERLVERPGGRPDGYDASATAGMHALARGYLRRFPDEATRRLDGHPVEEVARVISAEPLPHAASLVERLAPRVAASVLERLPAGAAAEIVERLDPVRAVTVLAWLDDGPREGLLADLPSGVARELRRMMEFPPETAGRLMDPRALGFHRGQTVQEALAALRAARQRRVADVFLAGDDGRLIGTIPLQSLALALPDAALETIVRPPVVVQATAPQEEVVELLTAGGLSSLPVVDFEGRLLGVIRHDTLVTTAQEEVAADIQAMVGASRQERALSRVSFAVRKRLPWLEINLATAFLAAAVVGLFESTIAQVTVLAVLLPVVAGQSGNAGAQALAVTMRGLALREIHLGQWPRVLRKEAGVALVNGLAVAITTAAGVYLWSRSPGLTLVIGSSMVLSMVAAGAAGVLVPVVLTSLGQDPAQSSSIILTTITDVVGFSSFLGIATLLIGIL